MLLVIPGGSRRICLRCSTPGCSRPGSAIERWRSASTRAGKVTGSFPPGTAAPTSRSAVASPPSWPGYHMSRIDRTSFTQGISTGYPLLSTTTVRGLAAATASMAGPAGPAGSGWVGRRPRCLPCRRTPPRCAPVLCGGHGRVEVGLPLLRGDPGQSRICTGPLLAGMNGGNARRAQRSLGWYAGRRSSSGTRRSWPDRRWSCAAWCRARRGRCW